MSCSPIEDFLTGCLLWGATHQKIIYHKEQTCVKIEMFHLPRTKPKILVQFQSKKHILVVILASIWEVNQTAG